jgi:predicted transcriptional regulator
LLEYSQKTIALKMRRTRGSVGRRLSRLGISSKMCRDSFSKHQLAKLLHIRPRAIQRWIDAGLLLSQREGTEKAPRLIIEADEFRRFAKQHPEALLQGRVEPDRLEFVFKFVFPRPHTDLLPVREAKKERAAYAEQMQAEQGDFDQDFDLEDHEGPPGLAA